LVILSFALICVGAYYFGVINTQRQMTSTVTSTTIKTVTSTYTFPAGTAQRSVDFKDDFLLQVTVDKIVYGYGEQVTVYYNLTYLGKLPRLVGLDEFPFRVTVHNATSSLIGTTTTIPYIHPYNFTSGMSITAKAIISDGLVHFEPYGGGGYIISFAPGGIYSIQGTASVFHSIGGDIGLTPPPLTILITQKDGT
jgi:hypothetical protein